MNTHQTPDDRAAAEHADAPAGRGDAARAAHPIPLVVLAVLLLLEAAMMAVIACWLLVQVIVTTPTSYATAVAMLVLAVLAAAWLAFSGAATLRRRSWIKAAAVTWQVLQFAVGIGFLQGADAQPGIAVALAVPAVVGVVLAVSRPVTRATEATAGDGER